MNKRNIGIFLISLILSLFFVGFCWNFFSYGVNVLGVNYFVFWFVILGLFVYTNKDKLSKKTLLWFIPIFFIILGVGIYTTEFTKIITVIFLPIVFLIFTTYELNPDSRKLLWSRFLPLNIIKMLVMYLASFFTFPKIYYRDKVSKEKKNNKKIDKNVINQIIVGVLGFLVISIFVIIPLLSGADETFANIFKNFIDKVFDFIEKFDIWRFIVFVLLFMMLSALVKYWSEKINFIKLGEAKNDNSIATGIILVGVLSLYVIFLVIQINNIFINKLPIDFTSTERLVKTGFWQLFLLTVINIVFYTVIFNDNKKIIRRILGVFSLASLLLVFSSGYRVFLYVKYYGLSFEKFYAFYTVIFCVIVFVWFLFLIIKKKESAEILRNLAFLALAFYAVSVILPLETIIFKTNMNLTKNDDSRVNVNQLKSLNYDVFNLVENNKDNLIKYSADDLIKDRNIDKTIDLVYLFNETIEDCAREVVSYEWNKWLSDKYLFSKYNGNYHSVLEAHEKNDIDYLKNHKKKWYEKTMIELIDNSEDDSKYLDSNFIKWRKSGNYLGYRQLFCKSPLKNTHKWSLPIFGFEFDFDNSKLVLINDGEMIRINYPFDKKQIEHELDECGYYKMKLSPRKHSKDEMELYMEIFTNGEDKYKIYKKILDDDVDGGIKLKNAPNVKAVGIRENSEEYFKFSLLIELPESVLLIKNDNKFDKNQKWFSSEEYVDKVFKSKEFIDVVNSIRIIPIEKIPDNISFEK